MNFHPAQTVTHDQLRFQKRFASSTQIEEGRSQSDDSNPAFAATLNPGAIP